MQMMEMMERKVLAEERLSIADLLILTAGAAIALSYITSATEGMRIVNDPERWDWRLLGLVFYVAVGGIAMAAALLLLKRRITTGRPWPVATTVLFAVGVLCWCLLPLATNGFVLVLEFFPSAHTGILDKFYTYDPGACLVEGFLSFWPLVSLGLLVACSMTGVAPQWWLLRGEWPDWLGMWTLVAWSVPAAPLFYRILALCLNPAEIP